MTTAPDTVRVLIAGGGTAGHLLPGLAVADALVDAGLDPTDVTFAGGDRGVERELVPAAGFALTELPGRGIQRRLTVANLSAAAALLRGLSRGVGLVRRTRPDVVVVLGGYASFACGVGAVLTRRPLVLLEQNARAGAVNRVLRRFAAASAVSFAGTDLPRATVTGNPLRPEVVAAALARDADPEGSRRAARRELGLPDDRTVVLVTTGSLGARKVKTAVRNLVDRWAERTDVAIRHVIGRRDFATVSLDAPTLPEGGLVYQAVEYEDRMAVALAAADVAVARAGGGVAELAALGVPAVLVPLPNAPRDHQRANAESLVAAGGAMLLDDADCDADHLAALVEPLLADPTRQGAMAASMRAAAHLDAAASVAALVREVARGR
jgi:undecaprenyldiphospho-muramoylpentapeptide beta-N-acetylglucosaminyltransferase